MKLMTIRGYRLSDVVSALQKAIRRGDARVAGYFAIEMFESGFTAYAWRRLLTVSAEDCAGVITQEVKALYDAWVIIDTAHKAAKVQKKKRGRVFLAKAVILLCLAKKSRDADHLTNLVYDPKALDEDVIDRALDEARRTSEPIPDYAYDCHTGLGRKRGKTRTDFLLDEYDALAPRAPGLFDADVEQLRAKVGAAPAGTSTLTRKFPSKSSSRIYTATAHSNGATSCDCPAWRYVKAGAKRGCAHTDTLLAELRRTK